ncbi:MAG: glutamate racemase [Deltaproteobacteria bacterium]|nr:glutamate racemase [Deltaproteobacteria bacterium]
MIGIFDSGIGGLTVARAIMDRLPGYDIVYFGDTAHTPYGNKSVHTVINYAVADTKFLIDHGATIIVVACNTASSVAARVLSEKFKEPVLEVITPAVDAAITSTKKGAIGVIGTRATISSGIYERKIMEKRPGTRVYQEPCPLLVPLVEEGWLKRPETNMIVKKYLLPLKTRQIDTLILGCTHYPVLKRIIAKKAGKNVAVVDSSIEMAKHVKQAVDSSADIAKRLTKTGSIEFYVSDMTLRFEKTARMIIGKSIRLTEVRG